MWVIRVFDFYSTSRSFEKERVFFYYRRGIAYWFHNVKKKMAASRENVRLAKAGEREKHEDKRARLAESRVAQDLTTPSNRLKIMPVENRVWRLLGTMVKE